MEPVNKPENTNNPPPPVQTEKAPIPSSVTPQKLTKKVKKVNLLLPFVLLLITLILAATSIYFYLKSNRLSEEILQQQNNPTPTPIAVDSNNITSFTSIKYSYGFEYDKNIYSKELTDEKAFLLGAESLIFGVEIIETDLENPKDWWESQKKDPRYNLSIKNFTIQDTTVSNLPAIKITLKPGKWDGPGREEELYLFVYKNNIYKIRVNDKDIFSTFKITDTKSNANENKLACDENNGIWLNEYDECEGITPETCKELGGIYNDCASPCRNNPETELCMQVCVSVCIFK
jgi:hypothetical protein